MLPGKRPMPGLRALPPMTAQIATALGPVLDEPGALQQPSTVHVRYGSKADIGEGATDVRFTPKSRHSPARLERPLLCDSRTTTVRTERLFAALTTNACRYSA